MLCYFILFYFIANGRTALLAKARHRAELNQTLKHVAKWTRFANAPQKFEGFSPQNCGAKTAYFGRFSTTQTVPDCEK